jgi:hypothetical protein
MHHRNNISMRDTFIYLFILLLFFSYTNFGLYKSYPLNRNLVLEICKERVYTQHICTHKISA